MDGDWRTASVVLHQHDNEINGEVNGHHLASAALDGALDRDRLRHQTYEEAERQLQQLPGIGPFSAELILIRGMGAPDALPKNEKWLQAATRAAYQLPPDADIAAAADRWRPYRSWIALLMRASH